MLLKDELTTNKVLLDFRMEFKELVIAIGMS